MALFPNALNPTVLTDLNLRILKEIQSNKLLEYEAKF